MVKYTTRQARSMHRDLVKSKQYIANIRNKAFETKKELALEKRTNTILRKSLQNFSGSLYKIMRNNRKFKNTVTRLMGEKIRKNKRRNGKTHYK